MDRSLKKKLQYLFFFKSAQPLPSGQSWVVGLHTISFALTFEDPPLPHADPKHLRKDLLKTLKSLGPEDWVLLVCASDGSCVPDAMALCKNSEQEPALGGFPPPPPHPEYAAHYGGCSEWGQ